MKRASTLLLAITTVLAAPRAHALLLGGGPLETDCFAAFDGPAVDRTFVVCGDGDPGCDADATRDGACVFGVRILCSRRSRAWVSFAADRRHPGEEERRDARDARPAHPAAGLADDAPGVRRSRSRHRPAAGARPQAGQGEAEDDRHREPDEPEPGPPGPGHCHPRLPACRVPP